MGRESKRWSLDTVKREGYVKAGTLRRLKDREEKFVNQNQERWKEDVTESVERMTQPDVDTGFQYIAAGQKNEIPHPDLGAVPSVVSLLFSTVEEPVEGRDRVYRMANSIMYNSVNFSGVEVSHISRKLSYIEASPNYVYGWGGSASTSGYVRVLMWR